MPPAGPNTSPAAEGLLRLPRGHPAVRRITLQWRRQTGGLSRGGDPQRRTLIACSGGADSCGLALALASGISRPGEILIVAHIFHDLRPEADAIADRNATAELASRLGLPFIEGRVSVRNRRGNPESLARRARYLALAELAKASNCPFVATAHHADDQLETLLIALMRGSGPEGLAGVAERRPLSGSVQLVRPTLAVSREELQSLCRDAGWPWQEDLTNRDTNRLRAALRHDVIPLIKQLRPGVEHRAARSARLLAGMRSIVLAEADRLLDQAEASATIIRFPRRLLRGQPEPVLGAVLRRAAAQLAGEHRRDRIGARQLDPVVRAIHSAGTDPAAFDWSGLHVLITSRHVSLRRSS
jgi:tRNA(Ile)-lysidine synthase